MNDRELKTHVDEQLHDDFIVLTRLLGFESKSQFMRFLIEREVRGVLPQLQNSVPSYYKAGLSLGNSGARVGPGNE